MYLLSKRNFCSTNDAENANETLHSNTLSRAPPNIAETSNLCGTMIISEEPWKSLWNTCLLNLLAFPFGNKLASLLTLVIWFVLGLSSVITSHYSATLSIFFHCRYYQSFINLSCSISCGHFSVILLSFILLVHSLSRLSMPPSVILSCL